MNTSKYIQNYYGLILIQKEVSDRIANAGTLIAKVQVEQPDSKKNSKLLSKVDAIEKEKEDLMKTAIILERELLGSEFCQKTYTPDTYFYNLNKVLSSAEGAKARKLLSKDQSLRTYCQKIFTEFLVQANMHGTCTVIGAFVVTLLFLSF